MTRQKRKEDYVDDDKEEYAVQKLVGKKYIKGRLYYRVKWLGYKSNENSWVPVEDLNCQRKVDEYEKKVKSEQVIRVEEEALGEESILCTIDFGFFSSKILKRNENNQCWPKANAADDVVKSKTGSDIREVFWRFLHNRHTVWCSGDKGLPAEVRDIFTNYHFTNVYRELDTGTRYFQEQVAIVKRKHNEVISNAALIRMATTYRVINKVATFEDWNKGYGLQIPSTTEEGDAFIKFMERRQQDGDATFTTAHRNGGYVGFYECMEDLDEKMDSLVASLDEGLDKFILEIRKVRRIGNFFAQQITSDLHECGRGGRTTSMEWVILGPGARDGIKVLFPEAQSYPQQFKKAKWLQNNQRAQFAKYSLQFPFWEGREICLKNIEHVLCEFKNVLNVPGSRARRRRKTKGDEEETGVIRSNQHRKKPRRWHEEEVEEEVKDEGEDEDKEDQEEVEMQTEKGRKCDTGEEVDVIVLD